MAESSAASFVGSRFTWTIANFSRLNTKKIYSDVYTVGGYQWRIMIFPRGNKVDHLSLYVDVHDSAALPYGWSRYAEFSISVVNQNPQQSVRKDTRHTFNAREGDWGFTSFMPLSDLHDLNKGFLLNDALVIEAEIAVPNESKRKTGYAGLQNQGTTSYMNSLLQTLYHIPYFRKVVYHMPTTEKDIPSRSIALALQNLFYELQYSNSSVSTKDITQSFDSDTHDVQELNRVLCENLEEKMKGTVVDGTMQQLFEGHHMNYIECTNVNCRSTRKESFYDLQLDVKGCQDVYASLDKFVNVERLEGDNKYHTEQHGLQDARKGVLFIDFPPVLQLQLKRFEYDLTRDTMVKINDRYEFPLELDLDKENGKYLSPDADKKVRNLFTLHSVLVHSGGEHGGRYYAFIRPTLSEKWFKFDDDRVTEEDMTRALQEQFGGEEEVPQTNTEVTDTPFKFTKYSNAYMLVYIRKSDIERIICNVDQQDIAKHVQDAHLYATIKVIRSEDLIEQIGGDVYFDLVDHDKVCCFRVRKGMPFCNFKEEVAKVFGVPVKFQRFWWWGERQNHTYRPLRPLTPEEEIQSVGKFKEVLSKAHNAELKLFLEVELGPNMHPIQPPSKTKEDVLIFFKLYDPVKEELSYAGRLFVKVNGCPSEILTKLNAMAGFPASQEIELFKEIKFEPSIMCEKIDKQLSFRSSQLEDGDIVCFQKSPPIENRQQYRYPDVPSFLEYVHNNQVRLKEEHKKKAHGSVTIKIARNEDLIKQIGRDIHFDLVDHEKVRHFHVQRKMPFYDFKEEVAKEFGIPVKFQRFWLWAKRQNHTYRPHRPLTPEEEKRSVGQLRETTDKANLAELKLFLEVELGQDLHPIQPPKKAKEDILIFFKLYDSMKQEIRYVGRLFIKSSGRPSEIVTKLNVMAGFSCNQEIELYEEIKFEPSVMCEPINKQLTFGEKQIEDGDILWFQKSRSVETEQQDRYPDVPSFFQYMHNLQVVHFRLLEKPKEAVFHLQLSKLSSYDELVERVASQLGVDNPSKIRLTSHDSSSHRPKPFPIEYRSKDHLSDMLVHCNQFSAILYYEVLNIPQAGVSNQSKPSQCVICLDATVEGACVPCGHMAGCMSCLKDIKEKNWGCPICRTKIQQVIKIYAV